MEVPGVLEVRSTVKHSFTAESADKVVQFFNFPLEQFPTRILSWLLAEVRRIFGVIMFSQGKFYTNCSYYYKLAFLTNNLLSVFLAIRIYIRISSDIMWSVSIDLNYQEND